MFRSVKILFALLTLGLVGAGDAAEFRPCRVTGKTEAKTWIVSNCGQVTQADEKGNYELTLPVQGVYCLKAMKDGFDEVARPWLEVPTHGPVDLPLWSRPNPAKRVVHGDLGHPAQLTIREGNRLVRGFDLAGMEVGSYPAPKGVWHQKNQFFWTLGEYCFTATGEVQIVESLDFPELRRRGWRKGDFHAHIVHGENFYHANLQQMAFICRAERYDWIYLAGAHSNDGYPADWWKLAEYLSDGGLFLRVNNEFPKNVYGHWGNLNCPPLSPADWGEGYDMEKVTDLELAEKTIYARGGLAVPVHPIYGDVVRTDKSTGRKTFNMINNEFFLWLLCRPEFVPVVDFFYFPEDRAEKFWYRLLNKGYTLACSGTSDAAFDVGRSPNASHATYAKVDCPNGESLVEAFRAGRTMVSYGGQAVLLEIDGETSGAKLEPGERMRKMRVDAYGRQGGRYLVRVVRNGEVFEERTFTAPDNGEFSFERELTERDNAWYVVTLRSIDAHDKASLISAASPIYFRNADFRAPEVVPMPRPLPAIIKERLRYLTSDEVDTDAWYDELKGLLKAANNSADWS